MRPKTEYGFTLLELMVVVVILSVLTLVAVASFSRYKKNARRGEAVELMNDIRIKQEAFFAHYSQYVSAPDDNVANFSGTPGSGASADLFSWDTDCTKSPDDPWCRIGFRPSGMTVNGVENHLHFQLRTTGWRPGGPKAPGFITNPNSYWVGVQARSAKDGSRCVFFQLTNQIKDVLTFDDAPEGASCP